MSEKNVSMYTRASSIRSNYTTATTGPKTKFMLPYRNNNGTTNGQNVIHHYNALQMVETTVKNNNLVNSQCSNNNWNTKSSWQFGETSIGDDTNTTTTSTIATTSTMTSTTNDWQQDQRKQCVCFPKICYKNSNLNSMGGNNKTSTIMSTGQKQSCFETNGDTHEPIKNCCCQQLTMGLRKTNENGFDDKNRQMSNNDIENFQVVKTMTTPIRNDIVDDVVDEEGDFDFKKSIIHINNIYNSCRDADITQFNESDTFLQQFCKKSDHQCEPDVNL